jgi:hypothetical protein
MPCLTVQGGAKAIAMRYTSGARAAMAELDDLAGSLA